MIVVLHLGFYSFFLFVAEFIGTQIFIKLFYRIGIKVFHHFYEVQFLKINIEPSRIFKMDEGKFKLINNGQFLFTSRLHISKIFRISTPFPFKGTAILNENKIDIYGRFPIGSTLFFLFWTIGWTASSFENNIAFCLMGWLFVGLMVAISLPIEKKRMLKMISELKTILQDNSVKAN